MVSRGLIAVLILAALGAPVWGSILIFLDDVDDYRFVGKVVETEPVKAQARELKALGERLMKLQRPALKKLLGAPGVKPPKAFAMPLAEQRAIGLSGLRRTDDERPDEHFINFHPVGDYAAVEVYYGRTPSGDEPVAVRFYLRADDAFPRLNADNADKRLAWEWERIAKLTKYLNDHEREAAGAPRDPSLPAE
jgi:hypothetical protein